jgi:hypothetical protein
MTKATSQLVYAGVLALVTITTSVLLLPEPLGSGGPLTWARVPLPILFSSLAGLQAYRAGRGGENSNANALFEVAILAAAIMMILAV